MARRMLPCWCVMMLSLGLAAGWLVPAWADEDPASPPAAEIKDDYELLSILVDTLDQVERNYVQDLSRRELLEAAIDGVLQKLDPYSSYITPDDMNRFRTSVESSFGGIGIQITLENGRLKVMSPLVNTPAYRAGLLAGDWIVEIEGESTENITIDEAVAKLKGEIGTSVELTVVHAGTAEQLTVDVTREVIHVETVLGDQRGDDDQWDWMLDRDRKIGYLRITGFSRDTASQVRRALQQLQSDGMRGLVLDLRFNPGGLLSSAVEISDLFISEGRIVSTEGRNSRARVWDAHDEGTFEGFPIAVLVNHGSASASEILAACLQDHHKAVIIGERTWGKGSVQNVIELEGGRSALKLTTASYLRPNGKNIHRFPDSDEDDEWGVLPDDGYEVKLSPVETGRLIEYRRQRDVLLSKRGASAEGAAAEVEPEAEAKGPDDSPAEEPKNDESDDEESDDSETPQSFVDRQLQRALDYLSGELAKAE